MTTPDRSSIQVHGARENSLKDVSLDIPKHQITVFTGVSGSGKSSLVFGKPHVRRRRARGDEPAVPGLPGLPLLRLGPRLPHRRAQPRRVCRDAGDRAGLVPRGPGRAHGRPGADGAGHPPAGPGVHRAGLPVARPVDADAVRRRGAARQDGPPPRVVADRPGLRLRRAVGGPAPARRRAAQHDAAAAPGQGQHRAGRRAQAAGHGDRRPRRRHEPGGGQRRRRGGLRGDVRRAEAGPTPAPAGTCRCARPCAGRAPAPTPGRNVARVLQLSAQEAAAFFPEKAVRSVLTAMVDVGLGYLSLGQTLNTLSGGERQRLKLAMELGKSGHVHLLDEPTTGLHLGDVEVPVGLLDRLVDGGSVVLEGTPYDLVSSGTTTGESLRTPLG